MTALVASAALTSCSNPPVALDEPTVSSDVAAVCGALADALPERVEGQQRRATEPESALLAAWGDPAITLRCGAPEPAGLVVADLVEVNDVAWYPQELTAGYRFTTTGRVANIEVDVPDDYAPEVNPLVDLADAITSAVPPSAE